MGTEGRGKGCGGAPTPTSFGREGDVASWVVQSSTLIRPFFLRVQSSLFSYQP